jgi:uncharacterized protein YlxP (DUF503 family)
MPARVAALVVEVHIAQSHSLKDKRQVVRAVLDGARTRFRVAAAETDHADTWQRAQLTFAAASGSVGHTDEVLDGVERFVWSFPELEVLDHTRTHLEVD